MQINPEDRRLNNNHHLRGDINLRRIEKSVVNIDIMDPAYDDSNIDDGGKYDSKFEERKQKLMDRKRRYLTKKMSLKADILHEVGNNGQNLSSLSSPSLSPQLDLLTGNNESNKIRVELQSRITELKNKIRKGAVKRSEQLFQLNEKKNDIKKKLRNYQGKISPASNNDNNSNSNNDNVDEDEIKKLMRIININKPSIKRIKKDNKILKKSIEKMQGFLTKLQNNNNAILKSQRNSLVLFVEAQNHSASFFQQYDDLEDRNEELKKINKKLARSSDALTTKYFKQGEKRYIVQEALEQTRKLISKKLRNQKIQKEIQSIVDDIKTKTIETFAAVEKEFGPIDRSE